jgi:hypothetical protein
VSKTHHPQIKFRIARMNRSLLTMGVFTVLLLAAHSAFAPAHAASSARLVLSPALQPGQKIVYHLRYTTEKITKSESRVVSPMIPQNENADTERLLTAEVRTVSGAPGHAQAVMLTRMTQPDGSALADSGGNVEFTLLADGRANAITGLDALSASEQSLWRQWLAQFALAWTFPPNGIKPGDKWKKEEPIVGSALAALVWEKQFEYVRNEPCPLRGDNGKPAKSPGLCAVVVTTTSMKQKSSHDDATPEDYKVHKLKTSGTARGKSQVITYISLRTRFLERATEESVQAMDILIAKTDESNKVHFNVDAKSRAEVVLVQ